MTGHSDHPDHPDYQRPRWDEGRPKPRNPLDSNPPPGFTNEQLRADELAEHEEELRHKSELIGEQACTAAMQQIQACRNHLAPLRVALRVNEGLVRPEGSHPAAILMEQASDDALRAEVSHWESLERHWSSVLARVAEEAQTDEWRAPGWRAP